MSKARSTKPTQKDTIESAVINFPDGLPGLEQAREWELAEIEDGEPVWLLRSVDRQPLNLLLVDPTLINPDYAPKLTVADLSRVGSAKQSDLLTFVVITPGQKQQPATINLRAPLLINPVQMIGAQIILDDPSLAVSHSLVDVSDDDRTAEPQHAGSNP